MAPVFSKIQDQPVQGYAAALKLALEAPRCVFAGPDSPHRHRGILQPQASKTKDTGAHITVDPIHYTPYQFIIDTVASITITNNAADFTTLPRPVLQTTLQGIASGLSIQGIGTAAHCFTADDSSKVSIQLPNVLFVPDCPVCLLCLRHVTEHSGGPSDGFNALRDHGILTIQGRTITVPYQQSSGLPYIHSAPGITAFRTFLSQLTANVTGDNMVHGNLSPAHYAKLLFHERCNHVNMKQLSHWIRRGYFGLDKSIANAPDPICKACQFGKARQKAHRSDTGKIAENHTLPGQGVSADQMEAGCPGKVRTTHSLPSHKSYKYIKFWVDHATRYIFPAFHKTKDLKSLVDSKAAFEAFAGKFGIAIQSIWADNGVYASDGFKSVCAAQQQDLTHCAVGGHWQNGIVERTIGFVTQTARTIILHAMASWPTTVTEEFWTFVVHYACTFHNALIRVDTERSPHHMFTGSLAPWKLQDFRVFGSPAYVPDKRLQDGDSLRKWKARSWLGVYVGVSLIHAGNVPVIYNPITALYARCQLSQIIILNSYTRKHNGYILPKLMAQWKICTLLTITGRTLPSLSVQLPQTNCPEQNVRNCQLSHHEQTDLPPIQFP
jgi:hypothetical protein